MDTNNKEIEGELMNYQTVLLDVRSCTACFFLLLKFSRNMDSDLSVTKSANVTDLTNKTIVFLTFWLQNTMAAYVDERGMLLKRSGKMSSLKYTNGKELNLFLPPVS